MATNSIANQIDRVRQTLCESFDKFSVSDQEKHASMLKAVDEYFQLQEKRNHARHVEVLAWLRYICDNLGVPLPDEFAAEPAGSEPAQPEPEQAEPEQAESEQTDFLPPPAQSETVSEAKAPVTPTVPEPAATVSARPREELQKEILRQSHVTPETMRKFASHDSAAAVLGNGSEKDVMALERQKYLVSEDVLVALEAFVKVKLAPNIVDVCTDDDGHIYLHFEDGYEMGPSPDITGVDDKAYLEFTNEVSSYAMKLISKMAGR